MKTALPKLARRVAPNDLRAARPKSAARRYQPQLEGQSLTGVGTGDYEGLKVAHPGIARALCFLTQNFHRPIKVRDLDEIARLSRRGFLKAFLREVGVHPGRLLRQLRIDRAKQLLRANKLPLQDVSARCGYRSVNSFWVSFRHVTDVSPGRFQQQVSAASQLGTSCTS